MNFGLECLCTDFASEVPEPFSLVDFTSYTVADLITASDCHLYGRSSPLLMMAEQAVEGGVCSTSGVSVIPTVVISSLTERWLNPRGRGRLLGALALAHAALCEPGTVRPVVASGDGPHDLAVLAPRLDDLGMTKL